MKKNIPNYITLLNLLCGIFSIVSIYNGSVQWSVYFIAFAAMFDFMDGAVARIFKLQSELGKQLDSLADMVSFGLAPGFIMLFLLRISEPLPKVFFNGNNLVPYLGFLIPLFSAWRLAKFNIDTRQEEQFIGIPTPASALMIVSLALINQNSLSSTTWMSELTGNSYFLISATIILSILLVAEIPLLSLKFKNLGWKGNQKRYILIILSIALIATFQISAIPLIFLSYIIVSLIFKK